MSQMNNLKIVIPHDDVGFVNVQKILETMSYKKTYWKGVAGVGKVEYVLGPFSQVGIDNAKKAFRAAFTEATIGAKNACSFEVIPVG